MIHLPPALSHQAGGSGNCASRALCSLGNTSYVVIIGGSQLTSVPERHQHQQGDQDVEGEGAGHLNVGASEPPLVLGDGVITFIPVLVRRGQTQVLNHMETLFQKIIPHSELYRGENLYKEHGKGMNCHQN